MLVSRPFARHWDPFAEIQNLTSSFEHPRALRRRKEFLGSLPVDITENNEGFSLKIDVPGVNEEQIELDAKFPRLSLRVTREGSKVDEGEEVLRTESWSGVVSRSFALPDSADFEKITASLKQGVLTIRVPKKEEAANTQIKVIAEE